MADYERLSAMDASFLGIEDQSAHMHVGAVMLFDAAPLRIADGGIDIDRIRRAVHARLHLVPRFRQRVAYVPWEGLPVWIDDDRFRLAYHVRHTALPRPGDDRVLKRLVGRIMSQPLDRTRPLWEMWVVEGLEGDRVALISKTHHCMVDGVSGADLMAALHTLTEAAGGLAELFGPAFDPVSATPFNVEIGPHRRFDWTAMRVADLKAVKNVLGGTLNDVVLATVSGALRRFFRQRKVDPEGLKIRAMVPVSVRTQDERGALGNRVTQINAPIPVHLTDPAARLDAVRVTLAGLKESRQALGGEVLTAISEWTVPNLLVQAVRLAARARPYTLVVTNVPGPQIPLYLQGALMRTAYPVVPLFEKLALVVGLFSYNGGLYWGINGDWEQLPDLHDFVLALEASFAELQRAAGTAPAGAALPETRERA